MLMAYYRLTKPGIIRGNTIVAAAGFFLASAGDIDWALFGAAMGGLALIIASACVFNNYLDRDIDALMSRTKKRALVTSEISTVAALSYAVVLGLGGGIILAAYTNFLTWAIALMGMFFYVVIYGIGKRKTVHGTVIGSISGAVPPVVGYTAVSGQLDLAAGILFLTLVFWQMPHFYAIAIFRMKDYAAANIPVLPLKQGVRVTKIQMMAYIVAFTAAAGWLTVSGYTGYVYAVTVVALGLVWLWLGLQGFSAGNSEYWAKKMFGFSLIVLLLWSIMVSLDAWLG